MSQMPQVATKTSTGTKVAVATLILAGLAALGYASGYVRLDYQSSNASSELAAEQCDCLWTCAETRKACIASGRPMEECNGDLGACVETCEPKDLKTPNQNQPKGSSMGSCELECKNGFDTCIAEGTPEQECLDAGAACMCECDPTFAPDSYNNSCAEQCVLDKKTCEDANANDPTLNLDCNGREQGCLNECTLWCDNKDSSLTPPQDNSNPNGDIPNQKNPNGEPPNDSSTDNSDSPCVSACQADYSQCQADVAANPSLGLDCEGRRTGCLNECGGSEPPQDQPKGDQSDQKPPKDN